MTDPRIPVTVLTGFLGAGKTTLLNRLLKAPELGDAAVVINEFGAVGIDHLLVEATRDDVVLLASGCLCCTIRGELVETLADLAFRRDRGTLPPFRRLIIETTGLADPSPILQTLVADPRIAVSYRLDGVVTVVDVSNAQETLDLEIEGQRQIAAADRLVLAKTDLVDDAALDAVRRRLAAANPSAILLDSRRACPSDLLGATPGPHAGSETLRAWLSGGDLHAEPAGRHGYRRHRQATDNSATGNSATDNRAADNHAAHRHDVNRHGEGIRAFSLTSERAIPFGRLDGFLDLVRSRHGPGLLRFKAIVGIAEEPDRPLVLHGVRHVLYPPLRLEAWPDAERVSRLVFIVKDLNPAIIDDLFRAFLGEPRLDAPDADAISENPLALR